MSEETCCFQADLWVGNKKVAHIKNTGRGGCDDVYAYDRPLLKEVEDYCESLPPYKSSFGGNERDLKMDLELYCINLMEDWRIAKDCKKYICFNKKGNSSAVWTTGWKGWTIAKLLDSPQGRATVYNAVNKIKADGGTILNKNLGKLA